MRTHLELGVEDHRTHAVMVEEQRQQQPDRAAADDGDGGASSSAAIARQPSARRWRIGRPGAMACAAATMALASMP